MPYNKPDITLRRTVVADLESLFQFQHDSEAAFMAAFTPKDPADKTAYMEKYSKLLSDPSVNNQTIMVDNVIAGSIAKFILAGDAEITYWLDKKFWGQGIATIALQNFLDIETARPIFARVACDNFGSQRVLEKSGFVRIGSDKGFANARHAEIEEFIYRLDF